MKPVPNSFERKIMLKSPRSLVWRALVDAEAFGQWFGVALEGRRFIAGEWTQGQVTYPGYEHGTCWSSGSNRNSCFRFAGTPMR